MSTLHTAVDTLESIASLLAAGHIAAAQHATAAALQEAREEAALYEDWAEREAAAEAAWAMRGAELIGELGLDDVPF